jgi:hypothetical protein
MYLLQNRNNNVTFGFFFFIFFLIVSFYPLIFDREIRIWSLILSLFILSITIIKPNLFTLINKLWFQFGILLSKIVSPIILSVIFFFIVVPTGMVYKILKKDTMNSKKKFPSYWINRNDQVQSMKKQF